MAESVEAQPAEELELPAEPVELEAQSEASVPCPYDENMPTFVSYCQQSCRRFAERSCSVWYEQV